MDKIVILHTAKKESSWFSRALNIKNNSNNDRKEVLKMGKRSTVYHSLVTPEKWDKVNEKNKNLINEFTDYLRSANKSPATIKQYEAQLRTFFVFVLERCENKFFVD